MAARRSELQGPARVLIVADEPLSEFIALTLNHGQYTAEKVASVGDATSLLKTWRPHLLVLDIDVESGHALALIGRRIANRRLPTIVITGRGDMKTKLAAFERGADDFIVLPLSPEELVARALALMRRTYGEGVPFIPVINVGGLSMDLLNQLVLAGPLRLTLTATEQALLYLLVSNRDKTLDRESILDALWGTDFVADSNLVDRHIRNLRVKLKDSWRRPRYIVTVPGKGYRFIGAAA